MKKYEVIATCADGDVLVSPKGGKFFDTEVEAKAAAHDHWKLGARVLVFGMVETDEGETYEFYEIEENGATSACSLNPETHKLVRIG